MKLPVIIPCYNEAATIGALLVAVQASPYPDKEIIVVDDGSSDGTRCCKANWSAAMTS